MGWPGDSAHCCYSQSSLYNPMLKRASKVLTLLTHFSPRPRVFSPWTTLTTHDKIGQFCGGLFTQEPFTNKIERLNPKFFSKITTPAVGKKGDITFFFNRTTHGVKSQNNNNKKNNAVVLIGFHENHDLKHTNLLISDETKNFFSGDHDISNYFEHGRGVRKKEDIFKSNIYTISTQNKLKIRNRLIYFYLNIIGKLIQMYRKIKKLV